MRARTAKQAFYHSIPVMAGYIVLGTGFGMLLRSASYGVGCAFAMSLLIFAGSLQFVGVSLISGGASVLTAILTSFMVNARHLFYSISMIGKYKDAGRYKPYMIFALTDETYSILCDGHVPEGTCTGSCCRSSTTATGSPAACWAACWAPCCHFPPWASSFP